MGIRAIAKAGIQGLSSVTTYNFGIVQNSVYRHMKQQTTKALAGSNMGTVEWALLGYLSEHHDGVRPSEAAEAVGVEPPFITSLSKALVKRGFIKLVPDTEDSRAKNLCITDSGKEFVEKTEPELRRHMRPLIEGVSVRELLTYYSVLKKIKKNSDKL